MCEPDRGFEELGRPKSPDVLVSPVATRVAFPSALAHEDGRDKQRWSTPEAEATQPPSRVSVPCDLGHGQA